VGSAQTSKRGLYLFTNDLRVQDNPNLWLARQKVDRLRCVSIVDPTLSRGNRYELKSSNPLRYQFLAEEHDPEAEIIRCWCPEIEALPIPLIFNPSDMTPMEEKMYGIKIGENYPATIIDLKNAYTKTRDQLWSFRTHADSKAESQRILRRTVILSYAEELLGSLESL